MSTMVPMYGFSGGGGKGATLTVTAPAGATVTVSKDGKTKTKVAGADGVAVFKGLSTGDWTLTITDGAQTAQKTVTVTADYETTITFFAATIHVTYPKGSTCTVSDGVTTFTDPNTSGMWNCVVPNAGTWTVSLDSGFSETVDVTTSGVTYTVNKWHLYNRGVQKTGVTGGFESTQHGLGVTSGSSAIHIATGGNDSNSTTADIVFKNKINLSAFSSLHAEIKNCSNGINNDHVNLRIGYSTEKTFEKYSGSAIKSGMSITGNFVLRCDVSGANAKYYVKLSTYGKKFDVTKIWLEV